MEFPMCSRMIKALQRPIQLAQLPPQVIQQLHRLNLNFCQRHSWKILHNSHQTLRTTTQRHDHDAFTRSCRHYTRTKRDLVRQMPEHRILRFEHFAFLARVRYLEHKLFTITTREKKVLVALTRQLVRARLNTEILLSYSLCENAIHRFHRSQTELLHAAANLNARNRSHSSPGANTRRRYPWNTRSRVVQKPALSTRWPVTRRPRHDRHRRALATQDFLHGRRERRTLPHHR